jgi:hypothetical protein
VDEDAISAAELVASFTGPELLAASSEISPTYDGLVLAKALEITMRLTRLSLMGIAKRMHCSRSQLYRWMHGTYSHRGRLERGIRELAEVLREEGIDSVGL